MLQFAPLAMIVATLLAASPLADSATAPTGVMTARRGLAAVAVGVRAFEQNRHPEDVCEDPRPERGSLATTVALMGCVTETVGEGATQAAGLATALQGALLLGASLPLIAGEAAPRPEAATASPLRSLAPAG